MNVSPLCLSMRVGTDESETTKQRKFLEKGEKVFLEFHFNFAPDSFEGGEKGSK